MKEKIKLFINQAEDLTSAHQIIRWEQRVTTFLQEVTDKEKAEKFIDLGHEQYKEEDIYSCLSRQIGYLDALDLYRRDDSNQRNIITNDIESPNKKIFVVHGHDNEAKEMVGRLVEKIGLEAIILHEQANEGLTIVEKFEYHSSVAFAVVLLTPDDTGSSKQKPNEVATRARQNVVFELGYFLGSLGRKRVCALYKEGVEIPSDYKGVLYIELDAAGAWKNKLAHEFVRADIDINSSGLLY